MGRCNNTSQPLPQRACQHRPPVLNTTNFPHDQLAAGVRNGGDGDAVPPPTPNNNNKNEELEEQTPEQKQPTILPNSTNADSIGFANSVNYQLEDLSLEDNDLEDLNPSNLPTPSSGSICMDRFETEEGPWAGLESATGPARHSGIWKIFEQVCLEISLHP